VPPGKPLVHKACGSLNTFTGNAIFSSWPGEGFGEQRIDKIIIFGRRLGATEGSRRPSMDGVERLNRSNLFARVVLTQLQDDSGMRRRYNHASDCYSAGTSHLACPTHHSRPDSISPSTNLDKTTVEYKRIPRNGSKTLLANVHHG